MDDKQLDRYTSKQFTARADELEAAKSRPLLDINMLRQAAETEKERERNQNEQTET